MKMRSAYPFLYLSFLFLLFYSTPSIGQHNLTSKTSIKNYTAELEAFDQQILKYRQDNDISGLAKTYEKKARFLTDKKISAATFYYEKSLQLFTKTGNKEKRLEILNLLATEYAKLDDRKNALKKMYELLDIYEKRNDTIKIAQTYSGIGSMYSDMKENDQALDFMLKALSICEVLKNKRGEAAIRNNIAGVYQELGELEKAFHNVRLAEQLNKESGNDYWLSINYSMYADLYTDLNMMDSVRYYLFKSNEYILQNGDLSDSISYLRKTGIYYLNVDSIQKSLDFFNRGILASRKLGSLKNEAIFTHWISELYERNGQMEKALSFLQVRYDLLDSLERMERGKRLEEYQVLYDVKNLETDLSHSKMNAIIAQNEADQNRSRVYWLLIVISAILIGLGIIFYQYRKLARSNRHLLEMNVNTTTNEPSNTNKYAQSSLTDGKKEEILKKLVHLMIDEQIFTDQDLKLNTVAAKLDISRTYLSQVINENYGQNFTTYINSYRINLAKQYLISEEYDKYSIQGIAEMVGFKSVSAFNTSFKKFTGLAPSYYRRKGRTLK